MNDKTIYLPFTQMKRIRLTTFIYRIMTSALAATDYIGAQWQYKLSNDSAICLSEADSGITIRVP